MKISRRSFVGIASSAAASALYNFPQTRLWRGDSRAIHAMNCAVLDLNAGCALRESLDGYRLALGGRYRSLSEIDLHSREAHRTIIIPAAGATNAATANVLFAALERADTVVWESGAAFVNASDFAAQQRMLTEHFDISIDQPKHLWISRPPKSTARENSGQEFVPYVTYHWPHQTRVRDFSRAISVSSKSGRAIAYLGELPVAWRKSTTRNTFIFLGSPLGPALRIGDIEAQAWLRAVVSEHT